MSASFVIRAGLTRCFTTLGADGLPPPAVAVDGYRLRRDKVDTNGKLTVRHAGRLHHIGMGRRHAGKTIAMLVAGRDIRILDDNTGELLRKLTLDPTRLPTPGISPMSTMT